MPSLDQTSERLLDNQEDIGNAVKPYYGEKAGDQLTKLLKEHILIAADLVNAAKAGDNSAVADADQRWSDNADDIAAFLAKANPNWDEDELSHMLHDHLKVTKDEAVARLQSDYEADIEAFDKSP
ncbi:acetylglutamate kinase [Candidatus Nitrososphaera gargensis]|uniref:acetylglutamate kinase n=1 Tax=Candidatus Nitrososphaera gargensis TaxID=497727 RepID=UPI001650520B|nr:acetylglutamate kinase [Candidatus Nitrososphaera gargensis]